MSTNTETRKKRYNRNEEVVAAAVEVMSERGYAATSIQEVADRVGVLKGSLYHYFRSKEELLFRIMEDSHAHNERIVQGVREMNLSAYDELLEYLKRISMWYLHNTDRANIFFTEGRHLTGERLETARQQGRNYEVYIQKLVQSGQEDGDIRTDIDGRLITRFLLGAVNNARFWPSRSGKHFSYEELAAGFLELVESAIRSSNDKSKTS